MRRDVSFFVIGGGELGAGHVRQLLRAAAAGRVHARHIVVVDRDPACAAGALRDPRVRLDVAQWTDWLDEHLAGASPADHFVPHHWAPHLLFDWLAREAERAGLRVRRGAPPPPRGLPFEALTTTGDRALSYAAWICPPRCIEPALCPHTRGARDWSLAADLETSDAGDPRDAIVLRCLHLAYGVGTITVADIHAARDRLIAGARAGRGRWQVATSSHCHALAATLDVTPAGR